MTSEASQHVKHEAAIAVERAGFSTVNAVFSPAGAGLSNSNWIAALEDITLFVKVYGGSNVGREHRRTASEAAQVAGSIGISPRLLAVAEDPDAEVYEFLTGYRPSAAHQIRDAGFRECLMSRYRAFHHAPPLQKTRTGFDQLDERLAIVKNSGAILPPQHASLVDECERARVALRSVPVDLVPCHNDSHFPNFMVNDAGDVQIVDWEYAANNDPCWDLTGIAFSSAGHIEIDEIAQAYYGMHRPEISARLTLYYGIMGTSWSIWAAMQAVSADIDFDYAGYASTLAERSQEVMSSPKWTQALAQLTPERRSTAT